MHEHPSRCSKLCTPLRGEQQVIHENVAEMQVVRNMNAEARIKMGNKGKKTEEKTTGLLGWC